MLVYLLVFAVVLVAALLAFGLAFLLHLQGIWFILFVSIVLLLGIGAAVVILVIHFRRKKEREAGDTVAAGVPGELDLLLNDANRKLKTAQQGSRTLNALPLIYILGDAGTAKTTQVMRSGLDPELLGGTAPRSGEAVPTPLVNLWITREAALLEAGEAIRQTPSLLTRLIERTRPKAYKSAFGEGAAARAAVVCLSAEQLQAADAGTALMASARATGAQLREISRLLGTPLPVYVLVTKLDRVPYFADFVRNLSNEEAEEVTQDVFARVASTIGTFESDPKRGSFRGWLMNLTRWRITDKFRERPKAVASHSRRNSDDPDRTSTIDRIPDDLGHGADWDADWQETVLAAAMERVAKSTKPKHFQVLDLYRRQNWSVLRISSELKMNAASVYTIKRRLTAQLKEEVDRLRTQIE